MNRLFFSHGDKGGVGKSMVSAVMVDYLLTQGKIVGVIEGDLAADIAMRFANSVDIQAVDLNRAGDRERAVMGFVDALDALQGHDVVVNLPAGSSETLEELADVLVAGAESVGFDTHVFYALGHQHAATARALRSVETGLVNAVPGNRRCMVFPAFLGQPEKYDWVKSGARDKYNIQEIVMPAIRPDDLVIKVLEFPGPFSSMLGTDSPLTLGERLMLQKKWLKPAFDAVSIFDEG
ncbi:hypothetical protein HF668_04095 [Acidithiobacillus ferridurans]|uniref:hypothetical protein n=1 Tax=Acidithiobacillus ferridurans TaxID=1232575 RepID=UPI001C065FC7|nr:hypothetical protein [Acidithiobacillus ferridurans]MBU2804350.1 hypothetical protein [Acidithiobacillus ferridurans]